MIIIEKWVNYRVAFLILLPVLFLYEIIELVCIFVVV